MDSSIRKIKRIFYRAAICGLLVTVTQGAGYASEQRFNDLMAAVKTSESLEERRQLCIDALKSGHLSRTEIGMTYGLMGSIYFEMYWTLDYQLEQEGYSASARIRRLGPILEESIRTYNIAVKIQPAVYLNYWNRGFSYEILGLYKQALSNYDDAIMLAPELPKLYEYRARVRKHMGDLDGAESDLKDALRLGSQ